MSVYFGLKLKLLVRNVDCDFVAVSMEMKLRPRETFVKTELSSTGYVPVDSRMEVLRVFV